MNTADDDQRPPKRPINSHKEKVLQPVSKDLKWEPPTTTAHPHGESVEKLAAKAASLALPTEDEAFVLMDDRVKKEAVTQPAVSNNPAAGVIRMKLADLYGREPSAKEEAQEAAEAGRHRSKHQAFMYTLSTSGKSLAEIQTAWHNYYVKLPDREKHEVWQEFYQAHDETTHIAQPRPVSASKKGTTGKHKPSKQGTKTVSDLKGQLLTHVTGGGKLKARHHLQSLFFGLGLGVMVLIFLMLGFFNERVVAPFVTPNRNVSATPIIIDPNSSSAVGPEAKVIVPKINLEVPVVYGLGTTSEKATQAALEKGVVHYATSPVPGQQGNVVIVGHSSNNILNRGKYKFAFVLLKNLEAGDTFMLQKDGKRYVYKIYEKKIVKPSEISVLGPASRPNSATLITCDPPGTSINRLVVIGEQISPDPTGNAPAQKSTTPSNTSPGIVPGNAQSLWQRIIDSVF